MEPAESETKSRPDLSEEAIAKTGNSTLPQRRQGHNRYMCWWSPTDLLLSHSGRGHHTRPRARVQAAQDHARSKEQLPGHGHGLLHRRSRQNQPERNDRGDHPHTRSRTTDEDNRSHWGEPKDVLPWPTISHHRGLTTTWPATMQDSPLHYGEDPLRSQGPPRPTHVHLVHDEAHPTSDIRRRQEATEGPPLTCTHVQARPDARIHRWTHYIRIHWCLIWRTPGPQVPHGSIYHTWQGSGVYQVNYPKDHNYLLLWSRACSRLKGTTAEHGAPWRTKVYRCHPLLFTRTTRARLNSYSAEAQQPNKRVT